MTRRTSSFLWWTLLLPKRRNPSASQRSVRRTFAELQACFFLEYFSVPLANLHFSNVRVPGEGSVNNADRHVHLCVLGSRPHWLFLNKWHGDDQKSFFGYAGTRAMDP